MNKNLQKKEKWSIYKAIINPLTTNIYFILLSIDDSDN